MLSRHVINIKGIGEKYSDIFSKNGIKTVEDLIMYFPKSYDFISTDSKKYIFEGTVVEVMKDVIVKKKMIITTLKMKSDDGEVAKLVYFNRPYMKHNFILGARYKVYGSFKRTKNFIEILNAEKYKDSSNGIIPKYNPIKGIGSTYLVNVIRKVLDMVSFKENLPNEIIKNRNLVSLNEAIFNIHFPKSKLHLERAVNRFKYQELLYFFLKAEFLKNKLSKKDNGIKFKIFTEELVALKESIGFSLTDDQNKVIKQIRRSGLNY